MDNQGHDLYKATSEVACRQKQENRVLIVDDELFNRMALKAILQNEGIESE